MMLSFSEETYGSLHPSIKEPECVRQYALHSIVMENSHYFMGPEPEFREWYAMNFFEYESLEHIHLDVLDFDHLVFLSKLPNLVSLSCDVVDYSCWYLRGKERCHPFVLENVASLVVGKVSIQSETFVLLSKLCPNLKVFRTLFGYVWSLEQRLLQCSFRNLCSLVIFLGNLEFSDHLPILKFLRSLKNLVIEMVKMKKEVKSLLTILNRGESSLESFDLELFRLESWSNDSEFDFFYETELFPCVQQFETLKVCIISSYHEKQLVPDSMTEAVSSHPSLKYVRYGHQVIRYPESNHEIASKLEWCRPILSL